MDNVTPLQKLIQNRRSTRSFLDKPVEREKVLACIEAARLAPSAENVQPWRFVVVDDPQLKAELGKAAFSGIYTPSRFAARAPVLIAVLGKKDLLANVIGKQIQGTSWYLIDIGIAGEHIVLQAQELGLGTCWIGWFNAKKVRTFLEIPSRYKVVILIAMGYYSEQAPTAKKRKALEDIVSFNGFKKEDED